LREKPMNRDEWYDLARDLDWTLSYVDEKQAFPDEWTGAGNIPPSAWTDWDEPFRASYREYVRVQREKDAGAYAVKEAFKRARGFDRLDVGLLGLRAPPLEAGTSPEEEDRRRRNQPAPAVQRVRHRLDRVGDRPPLRRGAPDGVQQRRSDPASLRRRVDEERGEEPVAVALPRRPEAEQPPLRLRDHGGTRRENVPLLVDEQPEPRRGRDEAVRLEEGRHRGHEQRMQRGEIVVGRGAKIHGTTIVRGSSSGDGRGAATT